MAINPAYTELAALAGAFIGASTIVGIVGKNYFITKKECREEQDQCQKQVCKKIDELKEDQRRIFDKLDGIAGDMGAVKQYMQDH